MTALVINKSDFDVSNGKEGFRYWHSIGFLGQSEKGKTLMTPLSNMIS